MSWKSWVLAVGVALASFSFGSASLAFEVRPIRFEGETVGSGASGRIFVRNTFADDLPVEISVERRLVAVDGSQSFEPADDDFVVFPPQALIPSGSSQAVQFQYVGEPALAEGEAYVIRVSQVPVQQVEGFGVQMVYEFGVALYLAPPGARAQLAVEGVRETEAGVEVMVRNSGGRHAVLGPDGLAAVSGASQIVVSDPALLTAIDNPIIPPNSVRQFVLSPALLVTDEDEELAN